jgi:hypothetical protein
MNVRWAGALVLAALPCAVSATAQDLKPGDRVRVRSGDSSRIGSVVETRPDRAGPPEG